MYDHVTVTVMINVHKTECIPAEKRIALLKKACSCFPNVTVDRWKGLLSDYMKSRHETIVIRGIRNAQEYEQESISATANRMLNKNMETVFIPSSPELIGISSSAVREIAVFGGDIRAFVPEDLTEEIRDLLSKKI